MSKLIESIVSGDFVSANNLFEQRIEQIAEKKLYETKRMMQTEVVKPVKGKPGEFTGQNTPADWAKYRKAHPALGMYDTPSSKGKKPESKVAKQRKAGYVKAADVLGDPSRHKMKPLVKLKKRVVKTVKEDALDEAGLAPTKIGKFYRGGLKAGGAIGAKIGDIKSRLGKAKEVIDAYRTQKKASSDSPFPKSMHDTHDTQDDGSDTKKKKETGFVAAGKAALGSLASQYGG